MHMHIGLKHKRERVERAPIGVANIPLGVSSEYIKLLDRVTFIAGIVGPFMVLPQIYEIFTTHQAVGVSALSWSLMFIVTLPWIFYGIAHKDRAIIWSFILWEVANATVVVGAFIYGK